MNKQNVRYNQITNAVERIWWCTYIGGYKKATAYLSPGYVVKGTRRFWNKRLKTAEILFTFGKPSYQERQDIKLLLKEKEPFPVKKMKLRR